LICLTVSGDEHKLWSSPLCSFLHCHTTYCGRFLHCRLDKLNRTSGNVTFSHPFCSKRISVFVFRSACTDTPTSFRLKSIFLLTVDLNCTLLSRVLCQPVLPVWGHKYF
jgi:hypothetical protein